MITQDVAALNAQILNETQSLAQAYAERFAGDSEGELRAWLHIAARREAMVSQVYGLAERYYRLPEPRLPAAEVAWDALTLIWQHEAVHTKFIQVRLADGVLQVGGLAPDLMTWLGSMEGRFLGALTSRPGLRRALSHFAVRLGAIITPDKVPDFTRDLSTMDVRDFFLLCGALETTARQSYERMEELAKVFAAKLAKKEGPSLQMENLVGEIHRTKLDETFHERAFQEMVRWWVDDNFDPTLTRRECAVRLQQLLPPAERGTDGALVVTDGGLGPLFEKEGLTVLVANRESGQ
jgi:hypothetical protein